ncbi:MAG: beta-aspartyl-peptidase [Lachnospiraceae bacterium]|jgi:beta-aspartyl-dipeptidase (metallo-type)|nr:beta-aspartyl-peptidase [Lachnospiraceae bacterium]
MIKLLKHADIYAPKHLGEKDVLIAGGKVCRIDDRIEGYEGLPDVEVFDLSGRKLVPGYIDLHVHITGGGGEQGPASRVPESQLSVFVENGITTVVGLLGTDGITRSMENLVAKAQALNDEGITAYALSSSYVYPPVSLTGNLEKDIMMVEPIIGVKIAVSDHRSSNPTGEELIRLATAARRAGLLSNKPGVVTMHMGAGKGGLDPVFYALDHSDLPARNLLPTHMGRNRTLIDQGVELVRRGGYIDVTAGCDPAEVEAMADMIEYALDQEGSSAEHVTVSSDGYGSQPRFNELGECVGLTYASPGSLHQTVRCLAGRGRALEEALKLVTSTPADVLGKVGVKGCVAEGADADLLVLSEDLEIDGLFARGRKALWDGRILMRGRFEL